MSRLFLGTKDAIAGLRASLQRPVLGIRLRNDCHRRGPGAKNVFFSFEDRGLVRNHASATIGWFPLELGFPLLVRTARFVPGTNPDSDKHTHTNTHRHTDTQPRRHADTQTRTHTHSHADTQTGRHADTQTRRHADTQPHRHRDTQTHSHADTQTRTHADTQTRRHADTQPRRHTDTQTHSHADTQTRTHTHTLKLQMESANLSSTTDESRVQLMSLEYN